MNRGGGLLAGVIELALAIGLLLFVLYWIYWAWVHYWQWILGGTVVVVAIVVLVRWVQSRQSGL